MLIVNLLKEFQSDLRILKRFKTSRHFYIWEYALWGAISVYGIIFSFINPLAMGLTLVGFIVLLTIELKIVSNTYYITDKGVMHYHGFLRRRISFLHYKHINDIQISQRLSEMMLELGTIHFNGSNPNHIRFRGIHYPVEVKRHIESFIEAEGKYRDFDNDRLI